VCSKLFEVGNGYEEIKWCKKKVEFTWWHCVSIILVENHLLKLVLCCLGMFASLLKFLLLFDD